MQFALPASRTNKLSCALVQLFGQLSHSISGERHEVCDHVRGTPTELGLQATDRALFVVVWDTPIPNSGKKPILSHSVLLMMCNTNSGRWLDFPIRRRIRVTHATKCHLHEPMVSKPRELKTGDLSNCCRNPLIRPFPGRLQSSHTQVARNDAVGS